MLNICPCFVKEPELDKDICRERALEWLGCGVHSDVEDADDSDGVPGDGWFHPHGIARKQRVLLVGDRSRFLVQDWSHEDIQNKGLDDRTGAMDVSGSARGESGLANLRAAFQSGLTYNRSRNAGDMNITIVVCHEVAKVLIPEEPLKALTSSAAQGIFDQAFAKNNPREIAEVFGNYMVQEVIMGGMIQLDFTKYTGATGLGATATMSGSVSPATGDVGGEATGSLSIIEGGVSYTISGKRWGGDVLFQSAAKIDSLKHVDKFLDRWRRSVKRKPVCVKLRRQDFVELPDLLRSEEGDRIRFLKDIRNWSPIRLSHWEELKKKVDQLKTVDTQVTNAFFNEENCDLVKDVLRDMVEVGMLSGDSEVQAFASKITQAETTTTDLECVLGAQMQDPQKLRTLLAAAALGGIATEVVGRAKTRLQEIDWVLDELSNALTSNPSNPGQSLRHRLEAISLAKQNRITCPQLRRLEEAVLDTIDELRKEGDPEKVRVVADLADCADAEPAVKSLHVDILRNRYRDLSGAVSELECAQDAQTACQALRKARAVHLTVDHWAFNQARSLYDEASSLEALQAEVQKLRQEQQELRRRPEQLKLEEEQLLGAVQQLESEKDRAHAEKELLDEDRRRLRAEVLDLRGKKHFGCDTPGAQTAGSERPSTRLARAQTFAHALKPSHEDAEWEFLMDQLPADEQAPLEMHPSWVPGLTKEHLSQHQSMVKRLRGARALLQLSSAQPEGGVAEVPGPETSDQEPEETSPPPKSEPRPVEVTVRIRPSLVKEDPASAEGPSVEPGKEQFDNDTIVLPQVKGEGVMKGKRANRRWQFHTALDGCVSQGRLFITRIQPTLDMVLNGFNACFLAYGQSGSGKTYTMIGKGATNPFHLGVIPRCFDYLYSALPAHSSVKMAVIEFYRWQDSRGRWQEVRDLLEPTGQLHSAGKVQIYGSATRAGREKTGKGCISNVAGITVREILAGEKKSTDEYDEEYERGRFQKEVIATIGAAIKRRKIRKQNLNDESSRGHLAVLTEIRSSSNKSGMLYFLDLAGSEKVKKSGVDGQGLQEAKTINESLYHIRQLVESAAKKQRSASTKAHPLTTLLTPFVGGDSFLHLICTIRPDALNLSETVDSLIFASSAMRIKNKPEQNTEMSLEHAMCIINQLGAQCAEKDERIKSLEHQLKEKRTWLPDPAAAQELVDAIDAYDELVRREGLHVTFAEKVQGQGRPTTGCSPMPSPKSPRPGSTGPSGGVPARSGPAGGLAARPAWPNFLSPEHSGPVGGPVARSPRPSSAGGSLEHSEPAGGLAARTPGPVSASWPLEQAGPPGVLAARSPSPPPPPPEIRDSHAAESVRAEELRYGGRPPPPPEMADADAFAAEQRCRREAELAREEELRCRREAELAFEAEQRRRAREEELVREAQLARAAELARERSRRDAERAPIPGMVLDNDSSASWHSSTDSG